MVLPVPVYAVKAFAIIQGIVLVGRGASSLQSLTPEQTRCSSIVSSEVLLGHRILMLFISWGLGLTQVIQRGRMIFTFFTVWNWWLLMLYFAFATMSTLKVVWERRKKSARSSSSRRRLTFGDEDYGSIGWIDRITVTLFQVVVPMTLTVTIVTWLVLVPMLMANPDPVAVEKWRRFMYSGVSYMQHGFNAVMALTDLFLCNIPYLCIWGAGWVSLWVSAYAIWSTIFFIMNGSFIYPFLDAHRPYAWAAYSGLYLFMWLTVGLCAGVSTLRTSFLRHRRRHDGKVD